MHTRLLSRLSMLATAAVLGGCSSGTINGQTSFTSAPPGAMSGAAHGGGTAPGAQGGAANGAGGAAGTPAPTAGNGSTTPRTVEETDLYRLEGNRLYYLNGYRGLMVFDVTNPDKPALLGRSAIYGSPVDMVVHNGIATVVVGDWYGQMDDGTPFHGSIVRGLDATDPANIKVLGEAKLGGWVQDDRVVGNVLYAVSVDYGWYYGWGAYPVTQPQTQVIVSSVSFANNTITAVGSQSFVGYTGIYNVTANSIMLAHDAPSAQQYNATQTELVYLDISDPNGAIVKRGSLVVDGRAQGWGADNGRWNLDFADGKIAHTVGQDASGNGTGYILAIADFTNPDAPVLESELKIPSPGWGVAARFDTNRLYLSPDSYSYNGNGSTPFQVYDTTDPTAPKLAGTIMIPGSVWNILPAPMSRIFALGNDWQSQPNGGDSVSLKYLDVTNPAAPTLLGTSTFGQGWAWTPAAGTFKAFTMDATKGLVVLPFSGWNDTSQSYNNGLQLIEFTPTTETTAGAAHTKGWVERGIFVGNRLVSLSDLALSVVDYSNPDAPTVTASLTLARNVVSANPQGATIAEVSSDWWDNDVSASEVRVLPIANAEESSDNGAVPTVNVDGVNARVFRNASNGLTYVVTYVRVAQPCPVPPGSTSPPTGTCYQRSEQVQVVDTSSGAPVLRGKVTLPLDPWGYYAWGWYGFYWYDWFDGAEIVQVGNDALAFRRWEPVYDGNGYYLDSNSALFVVDLSNPDAPGLASVTVTNDPDGWWGNMRVIGSTLYTSHYEWFDKSGQYWTCRYYVDRIDLSDRKHPRIESKINVPGLLIGGSPTDPNILYTIDYRWDSNSGKNDFDVLRLHGNVAELLSRTELDGWVGNTFIVGNKAYMSAQLYNPAPSTISGGVYYQPSIELHAIDLSNPSAPVDRVASDQHGWGWLLGVAGDRAVVLSGWGPNGVDIYQLSDGKAPAFSQFARTRGWWSDSVTRQDNTLYLTSGYWGVEAITLK
jgi:hypothetical protein